jgi:hypothetical protein
MVLLGVAGSSALSVDGVGSMDIVDEMGVVD